jgi:branched-chain amino acid transport system substrate-binding protein
VFDVSLPVADELMPYVDYVASLPAAARDTLTAAYPSADDPFATPPVQLAESRLEALGVKTVYSKTFPEEIPSYAPAADQVAAARPDIVVLGSADVPTVAAFMQQFRKDHYTPKMFLAAAGPDQGAAFISAVGAGNATGMMVPIGWYPGYNKADSQKMVAEYIVQYGGTAAAVSADVAGMDRLNPAVHASFIPGLPGTLDPTRTECLRANNDCLPGASILNGPKRMTRWLAEPERRLRAATRNGYDRT